MNFRYGCQIWGHSKSYAVENIEKIQNKAIRILNCKGPRAEASNLYKESKIYMLKVGLSSSKKICFICFNDSPSKMTKNVFYFILKAVFVLKIFKFIS